MTCRSCHLRTSNLGITWPQWRTLIFEGQERVDMRYACPQKFEEDVAGTSKINLPGEVCSETRERGIEGGTLAPALALLRKKTKEGWTVLHRNTARKLVLEEGWVQKRLFDIGWPKERKRQACHKEEGTEKHRLYHCQKAEWNEVRREIPETF